MIRRDIRGSENPLLCPELKVIDRADLYRCQYSGHKFGFKLLIMKGNKKT